MIVWSGFGYLVLVAVGISLVSFELLVRTLTGDINYYSAHGWVIAIGVLLSALVLRLVLNWLAIDSSQKRLIDPQTNQVYLVGRKDHLFFVPLRYWPFVLMGIGFLMLANDAFTHLFLT